MANINAATWGVSTFRHLLADLEDAIREGAVLAERLRPFCSATCAAAAVLRYACYLAASPCLVHALLCCLLPFCLWPALLSPTLPPSLFPPHFL